MKLSQVSTWIVLIMLAFVGCKTEDVLPEPGSGGIKVQLSVDKTIISEDMGKAVITATLSKQSSESVEVVLSLSGTAKENEDYQCETTIIIPAGAFSNSIELSTVQDTVKEGNETVMAEISGVVNAVKGDNISVTITIEDDDVPVPVQLILNEILYDPSNSGLDGDANGDGKYAQNEDEFIELINMSSKSVDLSGYTIFDTENLATNTPNHTIPSGTVIAPGKALLIFGGGTITGSFGGATVQTSTSGDLNLNNAGDELTIKDASGKVVLTFDIEPLSNNPNESYTRNPDLTGDFEQHSANTTKLFSPGTEVDGSPF